MVCLDNNKQVLYLLVKNPFTLRDFDRMGLRALQKFFNVFVVDCSQWLIPVTKETRDCGIDLPNLIVVRSFRDFRRNINFSSGDIAIDYIGQFSLSAVLLFDYVKKKGVKLVVVDSGACATPTIHASTGFSFLNLLEALRGRSFGQILHGLLRRGALFFLPDQSPDYALVSGESWRTLARFVSAKQKILAHSFDYERYLSCRDSSAVRLGDYAVYLDENSLFHEDDIELGIPRAVSEDKFVPSRKKFFSAFEAVSGMPLVVAGYPSKNGSRDEVSEFGGRDVVYGETPSLVKGAKLVFAHSSTALSFAVLWRKPIVFLTSDEIIKSWYHPWIDAPSMALNAPLVNIDSVILDEETISSWFCFDKNSYEKYQDFYIKSKGSVDASIWDLFRFSVVDHK